MTSGVFGLTSGIAVSDATGDLYITDTNNNRVDEFDPSKPPSEQFIRAWGWGVRNGAEELQTCTESTGCQAGLPGTRPGQLEHATVIFVDNTCSIHRPEPLSGSACETLDPSSGDVYVASGSYGDQHPLVTKFSSAGALIQTWGDSSLNGAAPKGQLDGSDGLAAGTADVAEGSDELTNVHVTSGTFIPAEMIVGTGIYGETRSTSVVPGTITIESAAYKSGSGIAISGGGIFGNINGIAVDSSGNLWVAANQQGNPYGFFLYKYKQDGGFIEDENIFSGCGPGMGLDSANVLYCGQTVDPVYDELYSGFYGSEGSITVSPTSGGAEESFGSEDIHTADGVSQDEIAVYPGAGTEPGLIYVANSATNSIAVFKDFRRDRPKATTGPPLELTPAAVTLSGEVDPSGEGPITKCYIEYGLSNAYGHTASCEPNPETVNFAEPTAVTATLHNLSPTTNFPIGTSYHYRFVATNVHGATASGGDETFNLAPPRIQGVSFSHVTATSADLEARVNPEGLSTTYHFEYGTTPDYGSASPEGEITGTLKELSASFPLKLHIENLREGFTYHFRFLATNPIGSVTSEDNSFEFLPPSCPNATVRQQTQSNYLPDCRAYELVSPGNANGTLFFPAGPNAGHAINPSRFSYVGSFGAISGAETIGTVGDLYVSTRANTGWVSHYIGLPGNQAPCIGPRPTEPRSHSMFSNPSGFFDSVPSDPGMNRFADWLDGPGTYCALGRNGVGDAAEGVALASNAGYLWEADGNLINRLPSDLGGIPGAAAALVCPEFRCRGESAVSGDLTHFVFSSNQLAFAPGGLTDAPGSAYDDNLETGEVSLISKLPGSQSAGPIPQDPTFATEPGGSEEFLRFPAVSSDGSRILISTATASTPECDLENTILEPCPRFIDSPVHLYMRVDDAATYEIAAGHAVHYVATTPDGTRVYFTSEEQLTAEDHDHSTDLYMWSEKGEEEGHPLTLISKGDNAGVEGEPGNTDSCDPAIDEVIERGQRTGGKLPGPPGVECSLTRDIPIHGCPEASVETGSTTPHLPPRAATSISTPLSNSTGTGVSMVSRTSTTIATAGLSTSPPSKPVITVFHPTRLKMKGSAAKDRLSG